MIGFRKIRNFPGPLSLVTGTVPFSQNVVAPKSLRELTKKAKVKPTNSSGCSAHACDL